MIRLFAFILFVCVVLDYTGDESNFTKDILSKHNSLRKEHKASALKWSNSLESWAQEWANKIAKEDSMYHRDPNEYGENIFWSSGQDISGAEVTQDWYDEIKDYKYSKPGFSMGTGHFTQVVWVSTKEIGCGKAVSKSGGVYVVCNYNPPGNYEGQYPKNVFPKGK